MQTPYGVIIKKKLCLLKKKKKNLKYFFWIYFKQFLGRNTSQILKKYVICSIQGVTFKQVTTCYIIREGHY